MADTVWLVIVFLTVALAVACVLGFHLLRQRKGQSEVILRLLNREYYPTDEPDERAASDRTQQLADHFSMGMAAAIALTCGCGAMGSEPR